MVMVPLIIALLAAEAAGTRRAMRAVPTKALSLDGGRMTNLRGDCFTKTGFGPHWALAQLGRKAQAHKTEIPGTGLGKVVPYDLVFKDGFMLTDCLKDSMFYHGDKFGDKRYDYEIGPSANVSIVHYDAVIAKEDRKPITPEECFMFCRTLKDMHYFGIRNGRDCYCEPYFERMASDSSDCDEPCDGDNTKICGGKTKSSIYEMHSCGDAPAVLGAAAAQQYTTKLNIEELVKKATTHANGQQDLSARLQDSFGQAGDPGASDLMQSAKVCAGELLALANKATGVVNKCDPAMKEAVAMVDLNLDAFKAAQPSDTERKPDAVEDFIVDFIDPTKSDFTNSDVATKGDDLVATLKECTRVGQEVLDELQALELATEPMINFNFFVKEGPCMADKKGCVMTNNHPANYNSNEACTIGVTQGEGQVKLKIEHFKTELWFDFLYVNNVAYHGSGTNQEGGQLETVDTLSSDLRWASDYAGTASGFKICGSRGDPKKPGPGCADQYYPVMYFVDKDFMDMPTTCTGDVVGKPIFHKDYNECACSCDNAVHDCVGFNYFPTGPGKPSLCFLISKFKSSQYYTGCDAKKPVLIQKQNKTHLDQPLPGEPTYPVCVAKLSKFVDTTLKPDPSGKCDQCMKKVTKAQRCWK